MSEPLATRHRGGSGTHRLPLPRWASDMNLVSSSKPSVVVFLSVAKDLGVALGVLTFRVSCRVGEAQRNPPVISRSFEMH